MWVTTCDAGTLIQVDPRRNRIVRRIPLAAQMGVTGGVVLSATDDSLWGLFDGSPYRIVLLDPDTGAIHLQMELASEQASGFGNLAFDQGVLWLGGRGILSAFDVKPLQLLATYQVTGPGGAVQPAVGFGSVWAEVYQLSQVTRLDLPAVARG